MRDAIRLRGRRLPIVCCLFILNACGSSSDGDQAAAIAPPDAIESPNGSPSPSLSPSSAPPSPTVTPAATTASASSDVSTPTGVVRYVTPSNAAAKDSGAGTASAPYKTLSYAIKQLRSGETLQIGAGTYRETLDLRTATNLQTVATAAQTKIIGAAGATVTIKGSDVVEGWEKVGTNTFVRRNWPINSQQVFIDGKPLQQIAGTILGGYPVKAGNPYSSILSGSGGIWTGRVAGSASTLVDNSFYYDEAGQSIYVRVPYTTLQGHTVEISARTYAIYGPNVYNLAIANLRVEHSNTSATVQNGAVTLLGSRIQLERIEVKYADSAGFDVTGNDSVLRNLSATYCGQVGIKFRGARSLLADSTMSYNNTRGFNKWWEAGGGKFVGAGGLQDSTVSGNKAYFNKGDGLWFDYKNARNKIYNNSVAYNEGMGIHYEASTAAEIYRNRIFGNAQRGIYLPNSSKSVIAHNLIVANGMEAIAIVDERGALAQNNIEFIPAGNYVAANIVGWNAKSAIVLPGMGIGAESDANLFLGVSPPTFSTGWASSTNPPLTSLANWMASTRHDLESWQVPMAQPSSLATAIQQRNTTPDFSALDSVAAGYTVPIARLPKPVPLIVTSRPGPK